MRAFENNCPINMCTGDGVYVGRCWHSLDNKVCRTHGDVSIEVKHYVETGKLTLETTFHRNKNDGFVKTVRKVKKWWHIW